jgi:excinuclease UvrABC nuclease subunit
MPPLHGEYERAARYRDLISTVEQLQERQRIATTEGDDADVFGYHCENGMLAVNLFHMRGGKIVDRQFLEDLPEFGTTIEPTSSHVDTAAQPEEARLLLPRVSTQMPFRRCSTSSTSDSHTLRGTFTSPSTSKTAKHWKIYSPNNSLLKVAVPRAFTSKSRNAARSARSSTSPPRMQSSPTISVSE